MPVVEHVTVFCEHFVIGRVAVSSSGRLGFLYDPRWLETPGHFPLSVTLPLDASEFGDETVSPWIANLLPEENQLTFLARLLGLSSSDSLAILREIGGDTAGAISFATPSDRSDWTYEPLTDHYSARTGHEALALHFDDLETRPFLAGEDGVRLSLAGGQRKTALAVLGSDGKPRLGLPDDKDQLAIPKRGAPSTIIIKPSNPHLPGIVENEAYCLALARLVGISAVDAKVMPTAGRKALAVARYDRRKRTDLSPSRIHQEDFAQANSMFPWQKYERGAVPGLDLQRLLRTGRHLPPRENLKLVDQVIFNILVANTDAHAKNYSMILSGDRQLAPLYDVSTVLPWTHVNQFHAQRLAGRKRKPEYMEGRHWDRVANDAGLNPRNVRLRVQQLVDAMIACRVEATRIIADQPATAPRTVSRIAELVEGNALRIASRL